MREILFRGKRMDNGEWVEGHLYITHSGEDEIGCYNRELNIERWTHVVEPTTVGQYIGLQDKNGKRIFEGDIVADNPDGEVLEIFTVEWYDQLAGFMLDNGCEICSTHEWLEHRESSKMLLEVIGNIHDNPELMDGGAEDEN